MTYNRSTEAYDIKSENTYEKIEMNGILSVGSKEIRLTVDQFALEGEADYTLSGDIAVTKGAVIDTMKGKPLILEMLVKRRMMSYLMI